MLEANSVAKRYIVQPAFELMPDNVTGKGEPSTSVATKFVKDKVAAFKKQAISEQKEIVPQAAYDKYQACLDAVTDNRVAVADLSVSRCELSIVWHDHSTGLRCKARIDAQHPEKVIDLKTNEDARSGKLEDNFTKSLWNYSYYTQAAFYQSGWEAVSGERLPFWFLRCVDNSADAMLVRSSRRGNVSSGPCEERGTIGKVCRV